MFVRCLLLLISAVLFVGCGSESTVAPSKIDRLGSVDTSPDAVAAISEDEAKAFADDWLGAVSAANAKEIDKLVLFKEIATRAVNGFDVDEKFRQGFVKGASQSFGARLGSQLSDIARRGSYKFVSAPIREGKRHIVLRVLVPEGGLNYHDFQLVRQPAGIRASHFYIAASGEEFADTLRGIIAPMIAADKSLLGKLSGKNANNLKKMEGLSKVRQLVASGNNSGALRILRELPEEMRQTKAVMLMEIMSTGPENEEEYLKIIDAYASRFPGDPSLGLVTLDAAIIRKDFEMLDRLRVQLNEWTGGDPFLNLMFGSVLAEYGELEKAMELEEGIDPASLGGVVDAHDYKMTISLHKGDHAETLRQLEILRDDFGYEFQDLRGAEGFDGFVNSSEFKKWRP